MWLAWAGALYIFSLLVSIAGAESAVPSAGAPSNTEAAAKEISPPPAPGADRAFGDFFGAHSQPQKVGVDWTVNYIGEVLANLSGGIRQDAIYEGLLKVALDVDVEKLAGWPGARVRASGVYPHGEGLSRRCLGDLFTLSNIDAPESARLFELWLQQEFWNHRISLRVGQLAADEEFAGTDYGGLFIDGTCGWPAMISLNAHTPAYPLATPGVRLRIDPNDRLFFQAGIYNGNPDPEDANDRCMNPHGVRFPIGYGAFVISELNYRWGGGKGEMPRGNAKLGGWWHSGDYAHECLEDQELFLGHEPHYDPEPFWSGNWGGYATVQQQLWRVEGAPEDSGRGLRMFSRIGGSPPSRSLIELYLEGGLTYLGLIPGREEDECGIALVYGRLSRPLRDAIQAESAVCGTPHPLPDYQAVLSVTYRVSLRAGWSLQPILEYLFHPNGSPATGDAVVVGIRTSLTL